MKVSGILILLLHSYHQKWYELLGKRYESFEERIETLLFYEIKLCLGLGNEWGIDELMEREIPIEDKVIINFLE